MEKVRINQSPFAKMNNYGDDDESMIILESLENSEDVDRVDSGAAY